VSAAGRRWGPDRMLHIQFRLQTLGITLL